MGIWNRVFIEGRCGIAEVDPLNRAIRLDRSTFSCEDGSDFHCLSSDGGICGLPVWGARAINAIGNLAERGYSPASVKVTLETLVKVAPSLEVDVHYGEDGEGENCIATIRLRGGVVAILPPARELIPELPEAQIDANMFNALRR